jgi:hypothetical protein
MIDARIPDQAFGIGMGQVQVLEHALRQTGGGEGL